MKGNIILVKKTTNSNSHITELRYGHVHRLPRSQREIWHKQTRRLDQAFWGGTFGPPAPSQWEQMQSKSNLGGNSEG